MGFWADKLSRLREAGHLLRDYAADTRSRLALTACYASLFQSATSRDEVSLRLRICGRLYPFQMRKSDIFTLAEIFHENQYALESTLPDRPTIIDAGANIGVTALWFLARHPGAVLHCFEPESTNFRLLQQNLKQFPEVTANQAAVGDRSGKVCLHLAPHGAEHSLVDTDAPGLIEEVDCLRLEDYVARHEIDSIDLLKLDVEGSEYDALVGLGDAIERVRVIVGEMHEKRLSPEIFYALLGRYGFRVLQKRYFGSGRRDGVHMFEAARTD